MESLILSIIAALCLASFSAADCSAAYPVIVASGERANAPIQPQVDA